MGKGYSKGNYGEETLIYRISPKKPKTSIANASRYDFESDSDLPDLEEVDQAAKLNHPGLTDYRSKPTPPIINLITNSEDDESLDFLEDGILASKSGRKTIGAQIANEATKKQYRKRSNVGRKSETAKSSSKNR